MNKEPGEISTLATAYNKAKEAYEQAEEAYNTYERGLPVLAELNQARSEAARVMYDVERTLLAALRTSK